MEELKKRLGNDAHEAITSNVVTLIDFIAAGNTESFVPDCLQYGIITNAAAKLLYDCGAQERARQLVVDVQTTVKFSSEYLDKFLVILVDQGGAVGEKIAADIVKSLKLSKYKYLSM